MNRFPLFCTALVGLFVPGGLFADDATPGDAPSKDFELKLSGLHEFDYRVPAYGDDFTYDGEMKEPLFHNELGLALKEGELNVVTNWQVDSTVNPSLTGSNQWTSSVAACPLENYVAWNPDKFKLGFGYQIFAWGVADGRNPTDNLNPKDYTTLAGSKPHKIPALSASVDWYPSESMSVEAVFIPAAQESLFPLDYQQKLLSTGIFSNGVSYQAVADTPADFVAGAKLNYMTTAADFSVSYLDDIDPLYTPVFTSANSAAVLERQRIHRFGADVKTTIDRYGLWLEACYTYTGNVDPNNYSQRLSHFDYTAGFDFNYGPGDEYYLNLQYTGTVVPGYNDSANTLSPDNSNYGTYLQRSLVGFLGSQTEGLTQGITWNAKWNLASDTVTPQLTGSYSCPFFYDTSSQTRYGNLLLRPEVDIMPVDSFHIKVGAILSYAWVKGQNQNLALDTTNDSLGIYTPSNNLYLAVSYQWNSITTK